MVSKERLGTEPRMDTNEHEYKNLKKIVDDSLRYKVNPASFDISENSCESVVSKERLGTEPRMDTNEHEYENLKKIVDDSLRYKVNPASFDISENSCELVVSKERLGTEPQLELDQSGIHVAEYLTELPPRKLLKQKLHATIKTARARIENKSDED